ncbi:MAG: hypothetical protein F6K62_23750 [Sphaerospermopsis sp. SIO1G2]|nr:hypothetical protein [Sphaerospermopsis sp. SIO1G2]
MQGSTTWASTSTKNIHRESSMGLLDENIPEDLSLLGDAELLTRIQKRGDKESSKQAIGELFNRYYEDTERYIYKRVQDTGDAGEVTAKTWDVIYKKIFSTRHHVECQKQ